MSPEALTIAEIFKSRGLRHRDLGQVAPRQPARHPPAPAGLRQRLLPRPEQQPDEASLARRTRSSRNPFDNRRLTEQFTAEAIRFIRRTRTSRSSSTSPTPPRISRSSRTRTGRDAPAFGDYGDVVEELDTRIGELLATLKELELDKHTIVVFTSDNGPNPGEQASCLPFRGEKWSALEGGTRVPVHRHLAGGDPGGTGERRPGQRDGPAAEPVPRLRHRLAGQEPRQAEDRRARRLGHAARKGERPPAHRTALLARDGPRAAGDPRRRLEALLRPPPRPRGLWARRGPPPSRPRRSRPTGRP